jgi:catechol 2,3-dioxygenase-like lactoylglutathione lyase family enzyme
VSSGPGTGLTPMAFRRLLAQAVVTDLAVAEQWYAHLFDGPPQARPMQGLLEWHLADTFGVQVWLDPDRAGTSAVVVEDTDLDATAARLRAAGVQHDGPQPGGGARVLVLTDPDGNQVVLTGT